MGATSRTTLILDAACMRQVRDLARREGRQISQVVNEILAEGLRHRRERKRRAAFSFPTYDMGFPRVNLADRDALELIMERGDGRAR